MPIYYNTCPICGKDLSGTTYDMQAHINSCKWNKHRLNINLDDLRIANSKSDNFPQKS